MKRLEDLIDAAYQTLPRESQLTKDEFRNRLTALAEGLYEGQSGTHIPAEGFELVLLALQIDHGMPFSGIEARVQNFPNFRPSLVHGPTNG